MNEKLKEKIKESLASVLPITAIVLLLSITIVPMEVGTLMLFLTGAVLLIVGMGFFQLGAEIAMTPLGQGVGGRLVKSKSILWIAAVCFAMGAIITISEPDLQVLANQVASIPNQVLIWTVATGVGVFTTIAVLRILFKISLAKMLTVLYVLLFLLSFFAPSEFIAVAFDAGGVTTGPMTVPFIMALGVGVASIRSDKNAEADSFGLVALCSIGPILAVMLLGFFYEMEDGVVAASVIHSYADTVELGGGYLRAIPEYMGEVALALAPIVGFFLLFQVFALHLRRVPFLKIIIGLVYTYVGLVLFLVGVNVGFSSLGTILGAQLAIQSPWLLVPIAMVMGWFIISAEPAVHVLNKQVEEISAGAVSEKAMGLSLSIAIALATGLAMVRVLTGISILWFVVPGFVIALAMSFFVPPIFTAIAFDSGGVASGPMTATFMLPFAMGACEAVGGNVITDAFGLVSLVAMMPLITVQVMGAVYVVRSKKTKDTFDATQLADTDHIELWEVASG